MDWMIGLDPPPKDGEEGPPSVDELRIVWLLAEGRTDEFVARRLGWTRRTLQRRFREILKKLGAVSRFQAGVRAERKGWISEQPASSPEGVAHSRQEAKQESLAGPSNNQAKETPE